MLVLLPVLRVPSTQRQNCVLHEVRIEVGTLQLLQQHEQQTAVERVAANGVPFCVVSVRDASLSLIKTFRKNSSGIDLSSIVGYHFDGFEYHCSRVCVAEV